MLSRLVREPRDLGKRTIRAVARRFVRPGSSYSRAWGFAFAGFHWDRLGQVIKGNDRVLVRDGKIQWKEMGAAAIGEKDLLSALRRQGRMEEVDEVRLACLRPEGRDERDSAGAMGISDDR